MTHRIEPLSSKIFVISGLSRPSARSRRIVSFNDTCASCFSGIVLCAPGLSVPIHKFVRHCGFQWDLGLPTFFAHIFVVSSNSTSSRSTEIDFHQFSSIVELGLFGSPMPPFFSLRIFRHT